MESCRSQRLLRSYGPDGVDCRDGSHAADPSGMLDLDEPQLSELPEWQAVLEAYLAREAELAPPPAKRPRRSRKKTGEPATDAGLVDGSEQAEVTVTAAAPATATADEPADLLPLRPAPVADSASGESPGEAPSDGEDESQVGWVSRLFDIPGVATDTLSRIHGGLIAYGLLKVQVGDRQSGVIYKVSPTGRTALQSCRRESSSELPSPTPPVSITA